MSAFIVDKTHIDALVSAGVKNRTHGLYLTPTAGGPTIQITGSTAEMIGQALTDLNAASVNHRYRDTATPARYTFRRLDDDVFTPIDILSLIAGYRYQACEIDGWDKTLAADYLTLLEHATIRELDGWDDAPWHLTETDYQARSPKRIITAPRR